MLLCKFQEQDEADHSEHLSPLRLTLGCALRSHKWPDLGRLKPQVSGVLLEQEIQAAKQCLSLCLLPSRQTESPGTDAFS